jgi:hypoxanthine phosphoribosyltransferase
MTNNDIKEVLISSSQIENRVKEIAEEISADYADKNPLMVGILKGAWVFLADLVRQMTCPCQVDFISASSYGKGTVTSGNVKVMKDLAESCEGRDVIIVEDIIDTGITLSFLQKMLQERKARSVEIVTFLSKPSRRKVNVDVKYVGYEIPDAFVVGYGMDYAEQYRELQYIGILKEEIYKK